MTEIIVACAGALLLLILVVRAVLRVPTGQAVVLERFGRFRRIATAGLRVRVPLLDQVRARVDLREQVITFPAARLRTRDDEHVAVALTVFCRITDVAAAVYEVANYLLALEQLARAALADEVDDLTRERALHSRRALAHTLQAALDAEVNRWGITVTSVELTIEPDES
jgi:regulator of protease activity HflC (stomatin/prohibitin superfamily)